MKIPKILFPLLFSLTILSVNASVYNVRDFGAKGDGKALDSPAINMAIEKAVESGSSAFFPSHVASTDREEFDVYLMIGQSNMAGRGELEKEDTVRWIEGVWILDSIGKPVKEVAPLNKFSSIRKEIGLQGYNPAVKFSEVMHKRSGKKILLVVNARGGSAIGHWMPGDKHNFQNEAIRRTRQAMKYGKLRGIAWHQGETDIQKHTEDYVGKFSTMICSLRDSLGQGDVPVVVGQVGQWNWAPAKDIRIFNDSVIPSIAQRVSNCNYVSSDGLSRRYEDNERDPHFGRKAQIELGLRYADAMADLTGSTFATNINNRNVTTNGNGNLIVNGVPWYDQRDSIVSAHGANIIRDNGRYYMFGEFKTDSVNNFKGFSCYSSPDLVNWTFERIALTQQPDGILGPDRIGERPKVLRCPSTGEYIMIMHSDDRHYKDPCTSYATSKTINGEYTFQGPLLYKGKPIRKWDIGAFTDNDGKSYLLVHHGEIYRFSENYHSLDSCMSKNVDGVGESPAMLRHNGRYYWFSSHTTSWERNDNMYVSSASLSGPWEKHDSFAPEGTNTWNSQTSFILPIANESDTTFLFMGDRWSFPKQRSAATYVWQPIEFIDGEPTLPHYWESWNPATMKKENLRMSRINNTGWTGEKPEDSHTYNVKLGKSGKIYIKGSTDNMGAYAEITIRNENGDIILETPVDFYSLVPADGLRYISPTLKKGKYTLTAKVSEMRPNWSDKKRNIYGSHGHRVVIDEIGTIPSE